MRVCLVILLVCLTGSVCAQYLRGNEELIVSYRTTRGKVLYVVRDKAGAYLCYRYGAPGKVELQYPEKLDTASWRLFTYDWYYRGGGKANAGLSLNSFSFVNRGTRYTLVDNYSAEDESETVHLVVEDASGRKLADVRLQPKSREGSLFQLRDYEERLLKRSDLYD